MLGRVSTPMGNAMAYSNLYRLASLLLGLACLLTAGASQAEVYRWVDAQGVVHYSDSSNVSGAASVELRSPTSSRDPRHVAPSTASQHNTPANDSDQVSVVRSQQCAKAKEQLDNYKNAQKIVATEADGSQRELTADEQVQEIVRTQNRVKALCGSGG